MRYTLPLQVLSSFEDRPGTLIVREDALKDYDMERQLITGIAYDKNEARLTLTGLPDTPGAAAAIFGALASASINYDMIAQGGPNEITFTVPAASLAQAADVLGKAKTAIGYAELATDTAISKVSIVGVGIRSDPALAARMFATLAERKIEILAIATSEIKVSVLIPEDYTELAVRVLHTAFGLDAEDAT
jgi:aspartate kinase